MDWLINQVRGFSFGGMTYTKGGRFGPIMRPYLAVIMIDEGVCTMSSDMDSVRVGNGQAGILAGRTSMQFEFPKGQATTISWCEGFLPDLSPELFKAQFAAFPSAPVTPRVRQLQEIGLGVGQDSSADLNSLRDAIGMSVCRSFLLDARSNLSEKRLPHRVLLAKRFMDDRVGDETLTVNAVAQHVSMSAQHLIASFKSALGTSPGKYLWQIRASRARQLLIHTRLTQAEIAYACGYKSVSHFSRALKKRFGMPPKEIRREMGFTHSSANDSTVMDLTFE